MAVITGRYGAVEIARPTGAPKEGGNSTDFAKTWSVNVGERGKSDSMATVTQYPNEGMQSDEAKIDLSNTFHEPMIVSSMSTWSLENTINPIEFAASNTHGYKGRIAGLHDATGNLSGLGSVPPLAPGQRFRFYGYTGPSDGVDRDSSGNVNNKGIVYAITAIVNTVQIQVSYQWNNPITWTIGWQADWHEEGDELWQFEADEELGFWDFSKLPCCSLMPSVEKKLEIWSSDNTEILEDLCLLDANIQFTNETAQYANSCSARAGGWQSRLAGPTTCSVSTNIQGDDFWKTGSLTPGTNHSVRIYIGNEGDDENTGGTDCHISWWFFRKLFFSGFSGLNIDTTSNTPLQFSCNMDFNAYPDCTPGLIMFQDMQYMTAPDYLVDMRSVKEGYHTIPDELQG